MIGANALPTSSRHSLGALLFRIVREPMFLLLIAATAICIVFGDLTEAVTLGGSVVLIMVIELVQERRTESALEALRDLASPTARVLRDGRWAMLDARNLVPGDAIQIAEGDRVPADARLAEGALLSIDESLLTGESVPVVRDPSRAYGPFSFSAETLDRRVEVSQAIDLQRITDLLHVPAHTNEIDLVTVQCSASNRSTSCWSCGRHAIALKITRSSARAAAICTPPRIT